MTMTNNNSFYSISIKQVCKLALLMSSMTLLAIPSYAATTVKVVDSGNIKSVGPVVWEKKAPVDAQQLLDQPVPNNSVSLFFLRPADVDVMQTSVNIAVNNRFQVSLQPGNYTQVYSCAGVNQLSALITGKKSNNLRQDPQSYTLAANQTYFFLVDVDPQGKEKIQQITADSAKQALNNMQYQHHQISRVVPDCPVVTTVAAPVVKAPPLPPVQQAPQPRSIELKILFDNDKTDIKPEFYNEVKQVADYMRDYPNSQVVIEGHTDDRGNSNYNQQLSQRRAEAVKQLLQTQFAIESTRVTAVGFGEAKPIANNDSAEGRMQNRRVVAVINNQ